MKKIFAMLVIAMTFSAVMVGALSVVPHVHGDDFDHSKHQTCPVYQQSLHDSDADVTASFVLGISFLVVFASILLQNFRVFTCRFFLSLRAPPVVS